MISGTARTPFLSTVIAASSDEGRPVLTGVWGQAGTGSGCSLAGRRALA